MFPTKTSTTLNRCTLSSRMDTVFTFYEMYMAYDHGMFDTQCLICTCTCTYVHMYMYMVLSEKGHWYSMCIYEYTCTMYRWVCTDIFIIHIYLVWQFSSLEKLIVSNNSTITEILLQLISDLQTSATTVAGLKSEAETQSRQLASLEVEVQMMLATMEEVKKNLTQRLDEVEGAGLSEEDMARVFGEEMDKSIKNNSSVLWVWLKEVSCTCYMYSTMYVCIRVHVQCTCTWCIYNVHILYMLCRSWRRGCKRERYLLLDSLKWYGNNCMHAVRSLGAGYTCRVLL